MQLVYDNWPKIWCCSVPIIFIMSRSSIVWRSETKSNENNYLMLGKYMILLAVETVKHLFLGIFEVQYKNNACKHWNIPKYLNLPSQKNEQLRSTVHNINGRNKKLDRIIPICMQSTIVNFVTHYFLDMKCVRPDPTTKNHSLIVFL